jgi:hypothetical protein
MIARRFRPLLPASLAIAPFLLCACDEKPATPTSAASAIPSAVAAAPSERASAAAPAAPVAWFVGDFSGRYEASHYLIEMTKKHGGVGAWEKDDGKLGSGEGKLALRIDESGRVTGTAQGPLGDMTASGQVEEEMLRLRLSPKDHGAQGAFAGIVVAKRKADGFEGWLQASTGDSLTVRDAPVHLHKGGSKPAPAGSNRAGSE